MIDLYSWTTPNGRKVHIMLQETGLEFNAHPIDIRAGDQFKPEFLEVSINNKIPAIIDHDGPDGKPMSLFESGAILFYLAEKTGKLLPSDPAKRYETIQWLMWQMGGVGPMFGQMGFFLKFAGAEFEDKRPLQRYIDESTRLLEVLDGRLEGREFVMDEYSIADIAIAPWLGTIVRFYEATEQVGWNDLDNVPAYVDRILARPAVQRGMVSPARP